MQGLRTSAREPLMGGQSFSSWRRKFSRRAASEDFEFGIVCICHNIHTKARRKCKKLKSRFTLASPVSAVTEGIRCVRDLAFLSVPHALPFPLRPFPPSTPPIQIAVYIA